MDPDAVLEQARDALAVYDAQAASAAYCALDEWLSGGGFLPLAWEKATRE